MSDDLRLTDRDNALLARIVSNPEICGGKPCIRGTRIRVIDILDLLAAGDSRAEILADYDYLTDDDISAVLPTPLWQSSISRRRPHELALPGRRTMSAYPRTISRGARV
ncbi:MAG: DUF433 domain-containing protein [Beijerinckiaceae bacterium]